MHARVAVFENPRFGDASLVDELTSRARQSAPRWREALHGARGHLLLFDRENNRSLGITFFDDEDQIREAEPVFERMGDEVPEESRGRRRSVSTYEVALQEGGEGARAVRVSTIEGPPDSVHEVAEERLSRIRRVAGFKGFLSLVDYSHDRTHLITLWESEEAMRASEQQAEKLRRETAEESGGKVAGVERYEVGYADRLAEVGAAR
jgi:heme-degrading monooxygenase HmoA